MWLFGPNVVKMEQRGDVKGLAKALRHGDPAISTAAAKALDRVGLPDDPKVRAWHVVVTRNWDAAVSLGEPSIVPLYTLIGSENDELRESAIRSLIAIGLPPATGMICSDDPDPVHLAFRLARSSQCPERDRKLDALSRLLIGCGEPALERLMGFVGVMALDPCEAEFVSVMLGRIGNPRAIQPLRDAMEKCMDLLEAERCMRCAVAYGKGLIAFGPESVAPRGHADQQAQGQQRRDRAYQRAVRHRRSRRALVSRRGYGQLRSGCTPGLPVQREIGRNTSNGADRYRRCRRPIVPCTERLRGGDTPGRRQRSSRHRYP